MTGQVTGGMPSRPAFHLVPPAKKQKGFQFGKSRVTLERGSQPEVVLPGKVVEGGKQLSSKDQKKYALMVLKDGDMGKVTKVAIHIDDAAQSLYGSDREIKNNGALQEEKASFKKLAHELNAAEQHIQDKLQAREKMQAQFDGGYGGPFDEQLKELDEQGFDDREISTLLQGTDAEAATVLKTIGEAKLKRAKQLREQGKELRTSFKEYEEALDRYEVVSRKLQDKIGNAAQLRISSTQTSSKTQIRKEKKEEKHVTFAPLPPSYRKSKLAETQSAPELVGTALKQGLELIGEVTEEQNEALKHLNPEETPTKKNMNKVGEALTTLADEAGNNEVQTMLQSAKGLDPNKKRALYLAAFAALTGTYVLMRYSGVSFSDIFSDPKGSFTIFTTAAGQALGGAYNWAFGSQKMPENLIDFVNKSPDTLVKASQEEIAQAGQRLADFINGTSVASVIDNLTEFTQSPSPTLGNMTPENATSIGLGIGLVSSLRDQGVSALSEIASSLPELKMPGVPGPISSVKRVFGEARAFRAKTGTTEGKGAQGLSPEDEADLQIYEEAERQALAHEQRLKENRAPNYDPHREPTRTITPQKPDKKSDVVDTPRGQSPAPTQDALRPGPSVTKPPSPSTLRIPSVGQPTQAPSSSKIPTPSPLNTGELSVFSEINQTLLNEQFVNQSTLHNFMNSRNFDVKMTPKKLLNMSKAVSDALKQNKGIGSDLVKGGKELIQQLLDDIVSSGPEEAEKILKSAEPFLRKDREAREWTAKQEAFGAVVFVAFLTYFYITESKLRMQKPVVDLAMDIGIIQRELKRFQKRQPTLEERQEFLTELKKHESDGNENLKKAATELRKHQEWLRDKAAEYEEFIQEGMKKGDLSKARKSLRGLHKLESNIDSQLLVDNYNEALRNSELVLVGAKKKPPVGAFPIRHANEKEKKTNAPGGGKASSAVNDGGAAAAPVKKEKAKPKKAAKKAKPTEAAAAAVTSPLLSEIDLYNENVKKLKVLQKQYQDTPKGSAKKELRKQLKNLEATIAIQETVLGIPNPVRKYFS